MHIEARLFEFIAAFFVFATVLYGVLTSLFATGGHRVGGYHRAGTDQRVWR